MENNEVNDKLIYSVLIIVIIGMILYICFSKGYFDPIAKKVKKIFNNETTEKVKKVDNNKKEETIVGPIIDTTTQKTSSGIEQEGLIAVAYLDPTNLNNKCNEDNSTIGSGIKGCMKWYIYSEDDETYTMILDHNTENSVVWNKDNTDITYENSGAYTAIQKLITDNSWNNNLDVRIISANEIATITNNTTFDPTKLDTWFYLDNNSATIPTYTQGSSKYAWLYDYTNNCSGCDTETSNVYSTSGYLTNTSSGVEFGVGAGVWNIYHDGKLHAGLVTFDDVGIRPVITVDKSVFK